MKTGTILIALFLRITAARKGPLRNKKSSRRLQTRPCVLLLKKVLLEDHKEVEELDCYDPKSNQYAHIIGPIENQLIDKMHDGKLTSGYSTLMQEGAYFDDGEKTLSLINDEDVMYGEVEEPGSQRRLTSTGTKNMLALRVVAPDSSTKASESEISDSWYGTNGDAVNLKSQYEACSFGKLRIDPAKTERVSNGVYTVNIDEHVIGTDNSIIVDAAMSKASEDLGNVNLYSHSGPTPFSHVMVCVPPGTNRNWVAYAYVNHNLSVYNGDHCNAVSIQMHEIGHNMGLAHSGQISEYDDESGMMGRSYDEDDGPIMCFNAVKSSFLHWYSDKETTVSFQWSGRLYGIADYDNGNADTVILKIPGPSYDWFVSFNRATGVNSGTREGGDKVLVHKQPKYKNNGESNLVTKLKGGGIYSDSPLQIEVRRINLTADPAFASIKIGAVTPTPAPQAPAPCNKIKQRWECKISQSCAWKAKRCKDSSHLSILTTAPVPVPNSSPEQINLPDSSCSDINAKWKCNKAQGCSWNVFHEQCTGALKAGACSQFDGRKLNCRKNGCKWNKNKEKCRSKWRKIN